MKRIIATAASTGGPQALDFLLRSLPPDLGAGVVIVQHMSEGFTGAFARRLDKISSLRVRVAEDKEEVLPRTALIAPFGLTMKVARYEGRTVIRLLEASSNMGFNPSADDLFVSVAKEIGPGACAIILTGMGNDGAAGMLEIRNAGGLTIAQDKDTSLIYGMPREAVKRGGIEIIAPLSEIPGHIIRAAGTTDIGSRSRYSKGS